MYVCTIQCQMVPIIISAVFKKNKVAENNWYYVCCWRQPCGEEWDMPMAILFQRVEARKEVIYHSQGKLSTLLPHELCHMENNHSKVDARNITKDRLYLYNFNLNELRKHIECKCWISACAA